MAIQPPRVVVEQRVDAEVGPETRGRERVVLQDRVAVQELGKDIRPPDDGRRADDAIVPPRLLVVGSPDVVERVVPKLLVVKTAALRRREIGSFEEQVVAVALFWRTHTAEGGRPI